MSAVVAKTNATAAATPAELFKTVGMTLVSSVGGASGPLYGTFFLRMGTSAGDAQALDAVALGAALRAGLDGVIARGKAEQGDKTMLDALVPALAAFDAAVGAGSDLSTAAQAALDAAEQGRDATEPLQAKKGRASYLGERSIGHLDPGAASTALLFRALVAATSPR
jgi:phosphoenolpyruvate---glycerone phosphotransferase subunit DhaL